MARNAKNTRMCAACRIKTDKSEMLRICTEKDGSISFSQPGKTGEGRGMYLCPKLKCFELANKKKIFSRNLRCEIPVGFTESLEEFVKSLDAE
ncbi:MAG: YlxR family protein [Clostridia bacterium]|nr:YlxR family protein [Clostridia bacterium]